MDPYVLLYVFIGVYMTFMVVHVQRNRHTPSEWHERWDSIVGPEAEAGV